MTVLNNSGNSQTVDSLSAQALVGGALVDAGAFVPAGWPVSLYAGQSVSTGIILPIPGSSFTTSTTPTEWEHATCKANGLGTS